MVLSPFVGKKNPTNSLLQTVPHFHIPTGPSTTLRRLPRILTRSAPTAATHKPEPKLSQGSAVRERRVWSSQALSSTPLESTQIPGGVSRRPDMSGPTHTALKSTNLRTLEAVCTQGVSNCSDGWERHFTERPTKAKAQS